MLFGLLAVGAALVAVLTGVGSGPARAAGQPAAAVSAHVVIVGISGLRWSDVSASATPALWAVARAGSPGSLVDFAVGPQTCPADAWLTLNGGDRAQVPRAGGGLCPAVPVVTSGSGVVGVPGRVGVPGPARVAAMPSLAGYNRTLKYSPRWGLLASAAGPGGCATAVGPGAALALAGPGGAVGSYLPGISGLSRAVLARCPLTVVDLGSLPGGPGGARAGAVRARGRCAGRGDRAAAGGYDADGGGAGVGRGPAASAGGGDQRPGVPGGAAGGVLDAAGRVGGADRPDADGAGLAWSAPAGRAARRARSPRPAAARLGPRCAG